MTAFQRPTLLTGEVFRASASTISAWSILRPWQQGVFIVLSVAILSTALSVVLVQHAHRQEMRTLHAGMIQRDQLNHAWSQLLVEQSAWAAMDHVESVAKEKLGMLIPDPSRVTYLQVDAVDRGRRVVQSDALGGAAADMTADIDSDHNGALLARQHKPISPKQQPES